MRKEERINEVGPIISSGPWLNGMLAAIKESNFEVRLVDRGSYFRVLCPSRCTLTRHAFLRHVDSSERWPDFLYMVMPSFLGRLSIADEKIEWLEN